MIMSNGTARTEDGNPVTPICAATYTQTLTESTNNMATKINQVIGQQLCHGTNEILISYTSVRLAFNDHTVSFQSHNTVTFN